VGQAFLRPRRIQETSRDSQSGARHFANAQHLVFRGFPDGGRRNRHHRDCLTARSEHLELLALGRVGSRRIVLDDHSDVACAQPILGLILRQHHTLVELKSHGVSVGMSVTSLGAVSPVKTI